MDEEDSILVPILNEDVTILSVVVPKTFMDEFDMEAMLMVDRFEEHPSSLNMIPDNKLQQARLFLLQNGMRMFFMHDRDEYLPDDL